VVKNGSSRGKGEEAVGKAEREKNTIKDEFLRNTMSNLVSGDRNTGKLIEGEANNQRSKQQTSGGRITISELGKPTERERTAAGKGHRLEKEQEKCGKKMTIVKNYAMLGKKAQGGEGRAKGCRLRKGGRQHASGAFRPPM